MSLAHILGHSLKSLRGSQIAVSVLIPDGQTGKIAETAVESYRNAGKLLGWRDVERSQADPGPGGDRQSYETTFIFEGGQPVQGELITDEDRVQRNRRMVLRLLSADATTGWDTEEEWLVEDVQVVYRLQRRSLFQVLLYKPRAGEAHGH